MYVEFIADKEGSGVDRRGQEVHDRFVQRILRAATVRFVPMLRREPIRMDAGAIDATGLPAGSIINVVHPAAYVLQKARIREVRRDDKRRKDMASVVDVVRMSRRFWPEMGEWVSRCMEGDEFPGKWLRDAARTLLESFEDEASAGAIEAEHTYQGIYEDPITASAASRIMQAFFRATGLPELVDA